MDNKVAEFPGSPRRVLSRAMDDLKAGEEVIVVTFSSETKKMMILASNGIDAVDCLLAANRLTSVADDFLSGTLA